MKKILIIAFVFVLLLSLTSAYSKQYDLETKTMTIKNNGGTDILKMQLYKNTYVCFSECEAIIKIDVLVDGLSSPFNSINIKKKIGGIWQDGSINSLEFQHNTSGSWSKLTLAQFNTGLSNSGTYYVRITGEKNPEEAVDWIPAMFGELDLDEWAVWDGSSIVAYYDFDDGSGSTVDDLVTHTKNGTTLNNPTWETGILGTSLELDGVNQYINISDSSGFFNGGNSSISFWIYPITNYTTTQYFWDGFPNRNYHLMQNGVNPWDFRMGGVTATFPGKIVGENISSWWSLNNWHHIVITYDSDGSNHFYADGIERANSTVSYTPQDSSYLYVGRRFTNANHLNARLDEMGFWNKSLTKNDITSLYNDGKGLAYGSSGVLINISLDSPSNGQTITSIPHYFNATYNSTDTGFDLTNTTYYIWYDNGTIYNNSYVASLSGQGDTSSVPFNLSSIGDYDWNTYVCVGNGASGNCTFHNENASFSYSPITNDGEEYNTHVVEGSNQEFAINITVGTDFQLSSVYLVYNNTNYIGSINLISGSSYRVTRSITIPSVGGDTTADFHWNITLEDGTSVNTNNNTQTITNFGLDDCSVNTIEVLNLTMRDEEDQDYLNATVDNTTIEVDLELFSLITDETPTLTYTNKFSQTLPARVCISDAINNSNYYMDVEIYYQANNYEKEYYHIQKYNLNSSSGTSQTITLYSLNNSDSTQFLITFKDESFLPVEDALVVITRKYTSDGTFKTVEIPITDVNGQTIGHFDTDNVKYTVLVFKNGNLLGTFSDITVVCENPVIGECNLNLNAFSTSGDFPNWDSHTGIRYDITFTESQRLIETSFTTSDGSVRNVSMLTTKFDRFGNTTVCSDYLLSSTGTLTCTVDASYGNVTLIVELSVDGTLVSTRTYTIRPDPGELFGTEVYVLVFFLMLTIPMLFISSPIATVFSVFIGLTFAILLNVLDGGTFLGETSSLIWAIISGGIIIWKITSRE